MIDTSSTSKIVELFGYVYDKYLQARREVDNVDDYVEKYSKLKEIESNINAEIFSKLIYSEKLLFVSLRGLQGTTGMPATREEVIEYMFNNNEFGRSFNVHSNRIDEFYTVLYRFFANISNNYSITMKE